MVHRKRGFFNRGQHSVHDPGSFKPVTSGVALGRGDGMGTGSRSSRCIRSLVPPPIRTNEALEKGLLKGEVAAYPCNGDPLDEHGPEVGVRSVEELCHVVQAMRGRTVAHVPGV